MKLIDKDKVVVEIERRRRDWRYGSSIEAKFKREECDNILSFIDTLETKDVNLEEECKTYLKNNFMSKETPDEFLTTLMQLDDMVLFAKHFFEFGLKAQKGE